MSARPINKFTVNVDTRYTKGERDRIGIEIINYIVNRTKNGLGVGNKPFKSKYSKDYIKTADFKIGGKSPGDVNLTLSGDMLSSVEVLNSANIGTIVIGFSDPNQSDKSVFLEEKGYTFLGVTQEELNNILSQFGKPNQEIRTGEIAPSLTESLLRGIFGR